MITFSHIVIHHSLTEDGKTVSWQAIRKYHIEHHGWSDIGYHCGVEMVNDQYEILVGRPLTRPGAHCSNGSMNRLGIGICFVGNYDIIIPPDKMITIATKRIIVPLCKIFGIDAKNVIGHREVLGVQKSCPGALFDMKALRKSIKDDLA